MPANPVPVLALNGSPSATSKTHAVAALGVSLAGAGRVVELGSLDADGLLGRTPSADVTEVLAEISNAQVLLLVTPVYRATYSGLLKVLLDQLAQGALQDVVCVLAATGGSAHHFLAVDTGLRPLVASLSGLSVPTGVYLTGEDFDAEGRVGDPATEQLRRAIGEAQVLAEAIAGR